MATETQARSSVEILKQHAPEAGDAFVALRQAVAKSGSLSPAVQELIVSATFAVKNNEGGFRTHGARALGHGASVADLRQAVLVTLGATATVSEIGRAMRWIDDLSAS